MSIEGARRVMETSSPETANQYLRFGWKLINQHVVEATPESPRRMSYVLASIQSLEDTKELASLTDVDQVNAYLKLGWRMIEKYVSTSAPGGHRNECTRFIVAWQSDEPPAHPGMSTPGSSVMHDFELGEIMPDT